LPLRQVATATQTRGQATHVAIIGDDPAVQPHLPQVILGARDLLPASVVRDLQTELPASASPRMCQHWILTTSRAPSRWGHRLPSQPRQDHRPTLLLQT
jgi:hypothetical protein